MDILDGAGTVYVGGRRPVTPKNKLVHTFQLQDSLTRSPRRTFTFGGSIEKYRSDNVFYPGRGVRVTRWPASTRT